MTQTRKDMTRAAEQMSANLNKLAESTAALQAANDVLAQGNKRPMPKSLPPPRAK